MKLLPCRSEQCLPRGGWALDRSGMAYYAERYPGLPGDSFRYVCHGCGRLCEVTADGFASLGEATAKVLERAGLLEHLSKDLRMALRPLGVTDAQAVDLFAWGLRYPQEVADTLKPREADVQ